MEGSSDIQPIKPFSTGFPFIPVSYFHNLWNNKLSNTHPLVTDVLNRELCLIIVANNVQSVGQYLFDLH